MKKKEDPGTKKQGFFSRWLEKLDKKLEEKAKKNGCGCSPKDQKGDSCCG